MTVSCIMLSSSSMWKLSQEWFDLITHLYRVIQN